MSGHIKRRLGILRQLVRQMVAGPAGFFCVLLTRITPYVYVAEFISLFPFRTGNIIRYHFYRCTLSSCGMNVTINFGSIISDRRSSLGNNVSIGTYNILGWVDIRDHTITAPGCHIVSGARGHSFDRVDIPIMDQPYRATKVAVGPDSWLGTHVTVMADIGRGCVIGAGSVVSRPVPDWSVAVGNPARVIRSRIEGKQQS